MTPIIKAIKTLRTLRPEYFTPGPGRIPVLRYPFQRPSLLTTSVFEGVPLQDIATPSGMMQYDALTWKEWFDEICAENLEDDPDDLDELVFDIVQRCHLNWRQKNRFLPSGPLNTRQAISVILCFCLQGALLKGAEVVRLDTDSFILAMDGVEWGIQNHRAPNKQKLPHSLHYRNIVTGRWWRDGRCANANLVRAHHAASKEKDLVAMEVINAIFWNIPEGRRIDSLFTI